jgi:hypothetical protein
LESFVFLVGHLARLTALFDLGHVLVSHSVLRAERAVRSVVISRKLFGAA